MSLDSSPSFVVDEKATAQAIAFWLNDIAERVGTATRVHAEFLAPSLAEVKECFDRNCTVTAMIRLSPAHGAAWKPIEIPIPYPYHGVFVMGSGNGRLDRPPEARLLTWRPCLRRRLGVWLINSYKDKNTLEATGELELIAGQALSTKQKKRKNNERAEGTRTDYRMFIPHRQIEDTLPLIRVNGSTGILDELRDLLLARSRIMLKTSEREKAASLLRAVISTAKKNSFHDTDDLHTKRLYTYQVFLIENLVQLICNRWLLIDSCDPDPGYWSHVDGLALGANLRLRMAERKTNDRDTYIWLRPFECRNAIDAISSLTAFSRYSWPAAQLEHLSARFRQNHPTFRGLICPVQTPESSQVGLTLHLAAGAAVDGTGTLSCPATQHELGYAASLIPFYHHTDAARAMMGAKNLVQALPIARAEPPLLTTGGESAISSALAPLVNAALLPGKEQFFAPGRNLLVAYMPWYGLNYNDAIVANASLADELSFSEDLRFTEYLEPKTYLVSFPGSDMNGLHHTHERVAANDAIAFIQDRNGLRPLRCGVDGHLLDLTHYRMPEHSPYGGMIEWTVRVEYRVGPGDKLMGRHGNKGVISAMLPASQMPRLPTDERLGALSGRTIDLLLNPLGVISRMNIGQLIESHVGLLLRMGVKDLPPDIAMPFAKVDFGQLKRHFTAINGHGPTVVDECGRMFLTIPGDDSEPDRKTDSPVTVGVQYIVRLDQIPAKKAHVRSGKKLPHAYDRVTGQAKQGKARNGGQRLGEMEMWAMDAYQSEQLMQRALTDAYKPNGSTATESQTFRAIQSMLFALGVVLERSDGNGYHLRWSDDREIEQRSREVHFKPRTPAVMSAVTGTFLCHEAKCTTKVDNIAGSSLTERSSDRGLCVEDLLRHNGITLNVTNWDMELHPEESGTLPLPIASESTQCKMSMLPRSEGGSVHVNIDVGKQQYHAYKRMQADEHLTLAKLLPLPLTCPEHTTKRLTCTHPTGQCAVRSFGGLGDPNVFTDETSDWGYIRLPHSLEASACLDSWANLRTPFGLVPVLPWRYREGYSIDNGTEMPHKLTQLYERIASAAEDKKDVLPDVKRLFNCISKRLEGKDGLICRDGLGRRVDESGRFVVIPDPSLRWDECGLPLEALVAMFRDSGLYVGPDKPPLWPRRIPDHMRAPLAVVVSQYLSERRPLVLVNRQPTLHRYNMKALRPVLLREPKMELDDLLGHRHQDKDPSFVMSINPLICQSMGCDFDGDEMSVHVVGASETTEALDLLPTAPDNLLSLANGTPVMEFDQDMVLGTYLMSMDRDLRAEFIESILPSGCATCRSSLASHYWDNGTCHDLLDHLCVEHTDDIAVRIPAWMRMAFKIVTQKGVSLSVFDLPACRPVTVTPLLQKWNGTRGRISDGQLDKRNVKLEEATTAHLQQIIESRDIQRPGFGIAAMALSGARGDKQVRQLVAARGYLDPGDVGFARRPADFFFFESLLDGMNLHSAFLAAMNGRSSMVDKKLATGKAGALTKQLVRACWPWRVKDGDCGLSGDDRSPATCLWASEKRICSTCYGLLPDDSQPPDLYPAGLIAAQSIGERGTQLSMKGFHTGTKAINIDNVKDILKNPSHFDPKMGPDDFRRSLKRIHAYKHIGDRHIDLLWQIIASSPENTLTGAVNREGMADLFAGLAGGWQPPRDPESRGGKQYRYISEAIKRELTSDGSSTLARVMIGRASETEEPGAKQEGQRLDSRDRLAAILGRAIEDRDLPSGAETANLTPEQQESDDATAALAANLDGIVEESDVPSDAETPDVTSEELESDDAAETIDATSEEPKDEDDFSDWYFEGEEMPDEDSPEQRDEQAWKDLPASIGRIGLVIFDTPDFLHCRVEMTASSRRDSRLRRLASVFGSWLAVAHPEILRAQPVGWPVGEQAHVLHLLKEHDSGISRMKEPVMSNFVSRAWLFWPNKALPVEALFAKGPSHDLGSSDKDLGTPTLVRANPKIVI